MDERIYTQGEVNRIFSHIPSRTLFHWAHSGLIDWVDQRRDGRGVHRLYTLENLWQIGLLEELLSLNLPAFYVESLMGFTRKNLPKEDRFDFWMNNTVILWKVRPRAKEDYVRVEETGRKHIYAYKIPGWHHAEVIPSDEVERF
ncbi:MAG: hypothetical protein JRI33_02950, partial [Deltaproteobacteria bacterium]|nr:hypothetical protein [Deltaproteobacteria bacterium]